MNCPQCQKHIPIEGAISCPFCASSLLLTAEEITKILELTGQESEAEKLSTYEKKRVELAQLIQNAPNQILKDRYQSKLAEIERAGRSLQGQAGAAVKSDFENLPSAGPSATPNTGYMNLPSSSRSTPQSVPFRSDNSSLRSGPKEPMQSNYSNTNTNGLGSGRKSILIVGAVVLLASGLLGYMYREAIVGIFVKKPNLIIRSSPSGVEVIENGEKIGKTPLEIIRKSDAKKQYSFTLGAPDYVTRKIENIILDDETVLKPKELDVFLARTDNRDNVWITSEPRGAAIYVDGKETGKTTPLRLHLNDGMHSVRLTLSGYADAERKEAIQNRNKQILFTFNLLSTEADSKNKADIAAGNRAAAVRQAAQEQKNAENARERKEAEEKEHQQACRRCHQFEESIINCWAGAPNASALDHECFNRKMNARNECQRENNCN